MTKAPLITHASESELRRATLASRFVTSAQFLSNEQVAFLLQNENHERIPELLLMAANLGHDQRLAIPEMAKAGSSGIVIPSVLAQEWESFWKAEYSIKTDLSGLVIPPPPIGYKALLLVMHEKAAQSPEMLFRSDEKAYDGKVWKFANNSLDEAVPTHKLTGTFGAWVADVQEAPDGCLAGINLSTKAVDELGWVTETLPLRQVHGRKFFRIHSQHLDTKVITVCAGSRTVGGRVPGVHLGDGGHVCVDCWDAGLAYDSIRFRRAVVTSKL